MIPSFKKADFKEGKLSVESLQWSFNEGVDERLIRAAERICPSTTGGVNVYVEAGTEDDESYTLSVTEEGIRVSSNGAAGAFYGLQTLNILRERGDNLISLCEIYDYPDMKYRGFYHDVTRGKVPTLDSLKNMVDYMVKCKLNSLQLYVEHAFEFDEYVFCREELGYMTEEETREIDEYCHERFIELIPSIATFGHLYHLLDNEKYKHLCELADYEPTDHYWIERMRHHTINPELPESFDVVRKLIDRYMPLFKSDTFNICCDETFDLGSDVNAGKDKGKLYVDFVCKLVDYLKSKGKKIMMWGDIILQHPEYINKLPNDIIFLNWYYSDSPNPDAFSTFKKHGVLQMVCPGTNTWNSLAEDVNMEEKNISLMAEQGYINDAVGILNTNWGDWGNICSVEMGLYGMACGAACGWNKNTSVDGEFRKAVSEMIFGDSDIVDTLAEIPAKLGGVKLWVKLIRYQSNKEHGRETAIAEITKEEFEKAIDTCSNIREKVSTMKFYDSEVKDEMLLAADGTALFAKWLAKCNGIHVDCTIDFKTWMDSYKNKWLSKNKHSELDEIVRICTEMENA